MRELESTLDVPRQVVVEGKAHVVELHDYDRLAGHFALILVHGLDLQLVMPYAGGFIIDVAKWNKVFRRLVHVDKRIEAIEDKTNGAFTDLLVTLFGNKLTKMSHDLRKKLNKWKPYKKLVVKSKVQTMRTIEIMLFMQGAAKVMASERFMEYFKVVLTVSIPDYPTTGVLAIESNYHRASIKAMIHHEYYNQGFEAYLTQEGFCVCHCS